VKPLLLLLAHEVTAWRGKLY